MGNVQLTEAQKAQVLAQASPGSTILSAQTIGSGREIQVTTSGAHIGTGQIIKIQPSGEAVRVGGFVSDAEARFATDEAKKLPSQQAPLSNVQRSIVKGTIQRQAGVQSGAIDTGQPRRAFRVSSQAPEDIIPDEVVTETQTYREFRRPGEKGVVRVFDDRAIKEPEPSYFTKLSNRDDVVGTTLRAGTWWVKAPFNYLKSQDVKFQQSIKPILKPFKDVGLTKDVVTSKVAGLSLTGGDIKQPRTSKFKFEKGIAEEVVTEAENPFTTAGETALLYGGGNVVGRISGKALQMFPRAAPKVLKGLNVVTLGAFGTVTAIEVSKQTPRESGRFLVKESRRTAAILAGVDSAKLPKTKTETTTKRVKVVKKVTTYENRQVSGGFESKLPANVGHARLKSGGYQPPKPPKQKGAINLKDFKSKSYTFVTEKSPRFMDQPSPIKPKPTPTKIDFSKVKVSFDKPIPKVKPKVKLIPPKPSSDIPKGYKAVKTSGGQIQLQKMEPLQTKTKSFSKFTITTTKVKPLPQLSKEKAAKFLTTKKVSLKTTFKDVILQKQVPLSQQKYKPLFRTITKQSEDISYKYKTKSTTKTISQQQYKPVQTYRTALKEITETKQKLNLQEIAKTRIKEAVKTKTVTKITPIETTKPKPIVTITPITSTKIITTTKTKIKEKPTIRTPIIFPRFNLKKGKGLSLSKRFKSPTRSFKYTPSVFAIGERIFGKQPKILTGAGIRPLPLKKKKKKRRKR